MDLSILNSPISASREPIDPFGVTCEQYARACEQERIPGGLGGAAERYRRLFRDGVMEQKHLQVAPPRISRVHESESAEGKVVKFTVTVPPDVRLGGQPVPTTLDTESVIIPMIGRKGHLTHTLCVSSQVGCAMGCTFCQTAQMGLLRNLTPAEVVAQWFAARHLLGVSTIRNIVFMGMGEPMDNLDNVIAAIGILTDHSGANMPMNKISVSTVGRIDGLKRLAAKVHQTGWHRLNLAVSLNAPTDEIRSTIMPINRAMPLAKLREAICEWPCYGGAKICFEYVLIPGVNDAREHARLLGDFVLGRGEYAGLARLPGLVNIIPYNPRENSPWPAPTEESVDSFLEWMQEERVYAKRRRTKGRETMAACGQLGNPALRKPRRAAAATSLTT